MENARYGLSQWVGKGERMVEDVRTVVWSVMVSGRGGRNGGECT